MVARVGIEPTTRGFSNGEEGTKALRINEKGLHCRQLDKVLSGFEIFRF
jgi:hypothetical protein